MSNKRKFFQVLRERNSLDELTIKTNTFSRQINQHKQYLEENSRPQIEVRSEVDKFRGFLHDVVSFEPDFILQQDRPRLHYYDEENQQLLIHELSSQTTSSVGLRNADIIPKDFSSIQIQNKVFLIGGEKKENEIRTIVATDCLVVNE